MLPKISIVMPAKNTAQFLPECLNSIIQQSHRNWELLAVNDHSTDETGLVLKDFAALDKRIKVFKNEGNGIIPALRLAYSKSTGAFVTRMDADDKMMPQKLEALQALLIEKGKGFLATGQVNYFAENGLGDGYLKYQDWLNDLTINETNFTEIYKECVIPSPCWMLHREDLASCNAFNSAIYPEDYDLCFRFYEQGLKVVSSKEILHQWRDYPTRSSRTDEHYSDNRFLSLKVHYFLKLDHNKEKSLMLWGAGKKGKSIAQKLIEANVEFTWLCNNENKIGKDIYGVKLQGLNAIQQTENKQIIISVAMKNEQGNIKQQLESMNLKQGLDYFFFC